MEILSLEQLFDSAFDRLQQRDTSAVPQRSSELCKDGCEQAEKGWLAHPITVDALRSAIFLNGSGINAAFRFAAIQGDKVRDFEDLRHSLTDRACAVLTPIELVSWRHVSHIRNLFAAKDLECKSHKSDHRDAYKSLPVCPRQTKLAAVPENPSDGIGTPLPAELFFSAQLRAYCATIFHLGILPSS